MKAFPSRESIYGSDVIGVKENNGMDLRDYFAGKAMSALIQAYATFDSRLEINEITDGAYQWADAMMKAREK
jgi:hypothetical protein